MAIFQFFKMAAVRPLGFSKVGNFNFRSHSEAKYASPYQISRRSVKPFRRYGRFLLFQDGGRPPSWICFTRVGTTHEEYLVVFCDYAKFGCNRCRNFDSMQILIFCTLRLKMPIHALKIGVFGGFYPQNGEQYKRDPQKAHPWAETRRMTYRSSKSVEVCGLGASRRIKQKTF